jgi:hypothetical protein
VVLALFVLEEMRYVLGDTLQPFHVNPVDSLARAAPHFAALASRIEAW